MHFISQALCIIQNNS